MDARIISHQLILHSLKPPKMDLEPSDPGPVEESPEVLVPDTNGVAPARLSFEECVPDLQSRLNYPKLTGPNDQ